jgi:hypothetical protein
MRRAVRSSDPTDVGNPQKKHRMYKGLALGRGKDETRQPLMLPPPLTMEAELAPTVPELLDRLAEFYNRDRDLIRALGAPRSSFYRWKFKGHRPNPQARAKIYQLAVQHGLIGAAPPTLRPRSQLGRCRKLESETMSWTEKLCFGVGAAALIGALAAALIRAA